MAGRARPGWSEPAAGTGTSPPPCAHMSRRCACAAYPALGAEPLDEITRADIQELVDDLDGDGLRRDHDRDDRQRHPGDLPARDRPRPLKDNPTRGVTLPSGGERRERFATPAEAKALIAALPARTGRYGRRRSTPACAAAS